MLINTEGIINQISDIRAKNNLLWMDILKLALLVDKTIIATTTNPMDDRLVEYCIQSEMPFYRGSERDVLGRVLNCAEFHKAEIIVDITADCPLVFSRNIDIIINNLFETELISIDINMKVKVAENKYDYCSNVIKREWPDGLDIQVYTIDALRKIEQDKTAIREHAGWNIAIKPNDFKIKHAGSPPEKYKHPEWGLTLDTIEDYIVIKRIFEALNNEHGIYFDTEWALQYIHDNPKILKINEKIKRNEVPK